MGLISRMTFSAPMALFLATALIGCATNGITLVDPQGKKRDVAPAEVEELSGGPMPYLLQVGDEVDLAFRVRTLRQGEPPWDYRVEVGDSMEVRITPKTVDREHYRIDVGDVIGISFLNNWPLNAIRTVRTDGKISLAELGDVQAGGRTPPQLQADITKRYMETGIIQGDPKITVNVDFVNLDRLESMSRNVTVRPDGRVRLPAFKEDVAVVGLTVSEASLAIGAAAAQVLQNVPTATIVLFPGLNATLTTMDGRVRVGPDGTIAVPRIGPVQAAGYSLDEVTNEVKATVEQYTFNPVEILTRLAVATGSRIYVGGEVATPGVYPLAATPTALQAVIMARGPINTSKMSSVTIIRRNPDGKPYVFNTNLRRALTKGSTENDITLRPFDTVYVPKKAVSRANLFVTQYIDDIVPFNNSLGVSGTYYMNEQRTNSKSRSKNLGITAVPALPGLGAVISP
jgi:polysaccharide export outer membrane protein